MSPLNKKRFCCVSFFCLILLTVKVNGQIAIATNQNLDVYADQLAGTGVIPFNVTFSGDQNQIGLFSGDIVNFGLSNGLILANGDVHSAEGPNNSSSSSMGGGNFGASDIDMDLLDGLSHNDAAVLEFDFVATGQSLSLQYVFASEEYPEYTGAGSCGSVSDVFGIFLSGPGITGPFANNAVNIALIPGTADYVSVFNLNAGCDGIAVSGEMDCNSCEYYVNNGDGFTQPYSSSSNYLQYDGFTVPLIAQRSGLIYGETYHLKIAIADVADTAFDSALFLKANSFSMDFIAVGDCNVLNGNTALCIGDSTELIMEISLFTETFEITQQGPSGGYVFYDKGNNDGGWRYLEVAPYDISAGAPWSCFGTLVQGLQSDIGSGDINTNSITQQCGSSLSAASICENAIINGFDDWYLPNQAEMNLIINTLYPEGIGGFNSGVGLNVATSQFNRYWTSSQSDLNNGIVQDFTPSGNGVSSKNNLHRVRPIRKFSDFDNLTYLWSTGESNDTIWVSPESTTTYTCSVFWNDQECTSSVEVEVIPDSFSLDSSDSLLCLGETIILFETGFDAIQWSDGSQSESFTISAPGDYWASAVLSGCDVHSDTLTVSESSLIIYTEPSDTVSFCGTSVIELTAYGGDSYMWNTGELSNTLQVTSEGIYYVVGFDSDCSGVSNSVYVIEESNIDINVFTEENVLCLNSAPAQLLATPEGGMWSGIGVEGNLFYPSLSGVGAFVITYSYEDSNGCQASANIFLAVNDCLNVEEITSNLYSIYPNPTSGIVNVVAKNLSEVALQIFSADGRLVKSIDYGGVTSLLDLTLLSNGIYFVNIQDKYSSYQMKLLKQ